MDHNHPFLAHHIVSPPKLKWVKSQAGFVPEGALVAGKEADGKQLFLARAFYNPGRSDDRGDAQPDASGWHPGKVAPHLGGAHIGFGEKSVVCQDYEVLIAKNPEWIKYEKPTQHRHFPFLRIRENETPEINEFFKKGLVIGKDIDGYPLYCCKITYKGGEQIGKAGPHIRDKDGNLAVVFAYGKEAIYESDFELLHKVEESGITTRWLYIEDEQAKERLSKEDWDLAFVGGWEADGRPLYVCRAALHHGEPAVMERVVAEHLHRDVENTHPGKCGPHLHGAHIAWAGEKEVVVTKGYEILLKNRDPYEATDAHRRIANPRIITHHVHASHPPSRPIEIHDPISDYRQEIQGRYRWKRASNGGVPEDAIMVARDEGGMKLYIARFQVSDRSMQIGKVGEHLGCAHVPFGGKTIISQEYEVLCKNM